MAHHHDHHSISPGQVNLAFILALVANTLFTILEGVYGFLTGSVSLLGDAAHNLGDVLGLLLAWGAANLVLVQANRSYSYGYRRGTILAALLNALILVASSLLLFWEAIDRLLAPQPVPSLEVMLIAGIGIAVNAGSAWLFSRSRLKGREHDLNLRAAFLHLVYDALISAGVVLVAAGMLLTGWFWLDPVMGLVIMLVILRGAFRLLMDSVSLIMDAVPTHVDPEAVTDYLRGLAGVTDVHDLHIWAISTHETGLTAHLTMRDNAFWHQGFDELNEYLRRHFSIDHATLQVEAEPGCSRACDKAEYKG